MSGWIEWKGGECPVDADSLVDVRFRAGDDDHGTEAQQWSWSLSQDGDDIIAYRLHHSEQKEAKLNGWINCSERMPENKPGEWSEEVAAVSDIGGLFKISCMGGYWQRTSAFIESGATSITHWQPLPIQKDE